MNEWTNGVPSSLIAWRGKSGQKPSKGSIPRALLKKFLMSFWLTFFAVVVVLKLLLGLEAHAESMLPDIASLTLHHELSAICIFLCKCVC